MIVARIFQVEAGFPDVELGRVNITQTYRHAEDSTADYAVEMAVERYRAVGVHSRVIRFFPRMKYNVLGLLRQALATLDESELELEHEAAGASDLARPLRGIGSAIPQKTTDPVRDNRPPLWG